MKPQSRDNNGRFVAIPNTECVPVPRAWIKRLLTISKTHSTTFIQGYIESAEGFLTKEP